MVIKLLDSITDSLNQFNCWTCGSIELMSLFSSRHQADAEDQTASDLAVVLFETATLRSGYQLADTKAYGDRIERMLRLSMNVPLDEQAS